MSDRVLKLIPEDKEFLPDENAAEEARELLEDFFPDGEQAELAFSDYVMFIDGGENQESVACSKCGENIDVSESDWWFNLSDMLSSATTDTNLLDTEMPCCLKPSLIQEIGFGDAAGFSKFELCIWNPYPELGVSKNQLGMLESKLGCKLKQIWAHY